MYNASQTYLHSAPYPNLTYVKSERVPISNQYADSSQRLNPVYLPTAGYTLCGQAVTGTGLQAFNLKRVTVLAGSYKSHQVKPAN